MPIKNEELARLQRMSVWFVRAAKTVAFLLLAANTTMWLVPDFAEGIARSQSALALEPMTLTLGARFGALIVSTVSLGLVALALWTAASLFASFAAGQIFVPETGTRLRRLGLLLLLHAVLSPIVRTLISVIVTIGNNPGQRALAVSFSSQDLIVPLIAILLVMLGHIMAEAARIAEDHQHIV